MHEWWRQADFGFVKKIQDDLVTVCEATSQVHINYWKTQNQNFLLYAHMYSCQEDCHIYKELCCFQSESRWQIWLYGRLSKAI